MPDAMGKDLRIRTADSAQEVEAIHRPNYRTFVLEIPQHPRNADERPDFLPFGPVVGHDGAWFQPMCLTFDRYRQVLTGYVWRHE